jgi:hypothetical protein
LVPEAPHPQFLRLLDLQASGFVNTAAVLGGVADCLADLAILGSLIMCIPSLIFEDLFRLQIPAPQTQV